MSDATATIQVSNLTKFYGDFCALDRLSFAVEPGEVVGFLGPNGAGKSTAMKILTCFMSANSGSAKVAGFDVYTQPHKVRERVGYLPENNPLYTDMIVFDYLRFIAEVRRVPAARQLARIKELAEVCGLRQVMHREIRELSKGFRQRVGLAQAMIHEPEVLILDEPTSGLDPNQILEIRDLIKKIGQKKTVILSTHILQEVEAVCDRILIIDRGKLLADGTVQSLAEKARKDYAFRLRLGGQPSDEQAAAALRKLAGVESVTQDDGAFVLRAKQSEGIAEAVSQLAAQQHWAILELVELKPELEDVFRALTGFRTEESRQHVATETAPASPASPRAPVAAATEPDDDDDDEDDDDDDLDDVLDDDDDDDENDDDDDENDDEDEEEEDEDEEPKAPARAKPSPSAVETSKAKPTPRQPEAEKQARPNDNRGGRDRGGRGGRSRR